jgi:hypothetical protein
MKGVIILLLFLLVLPAAGVQVLAISDNTTFLDGLKATLDNYSYTKDYKENYFDCADTCMIALTVLQQKGYQPKLMVDLKKENDPGVSHGWLAVPDGSGSWAMIETTSFAIIPAGLGLIVVGENSDRYRSGDILEDPWQALDAWGIGQRVRQNLHSYQPMKDLRS